MNNVDFTNMPKEQPAPVKPEEKKVEVPASPVI